MTSTNMQVLPLLCLCFLTRSGATFADNYGHALRDRSCENIPGAAPRPDITRLNQIENRLLLQCEVRGASPKPKVEWMDSDGKILPAEEPQVSERGGSFNIILQTTVNRTNRYRCVATQEEISHRINAEIYVYKWGALKNRSCENIPGAAAEPYITAPSKWRDWVLLKCEVLGASPKPTVEWQDSAGNKVLAKDQQVSERGGRYNITLLTVVTKRDYYRCVATQEEIKHRIHAETFVWLHEVAKEKDCGYSYPFVAVVAIVVPVAVVVIPLVLLVAKHLNSQKDSGSKPQTSIPIKETSL